MQGPNKTFQIKETSKRLRTAIRQKIIQLDIVSLAFMMMTQDMGIKNSRKNDWEGEQGKDDQRI